MRIGIDNDSGITVRNVTDELPYGRIDHDAIAAGLADVLMLSGYPRMECILAQTTLKLADHCFDGHVIPRDLLEAFHGAASDILEWWDQHDHDFRAKWGA